MTDAATQVCEPKLNDLVRIDDAKLRVLGLMQGRLILVSHQPPFVLYMNGGSDGLPGLPMLDDWKAMVAANRAAIVPPAEDRLEPDDVEKVVEVCALLDAAHVPQGNKAIAVWLHRNWSADLQRRFGTPSSPSTLRRWRARQRAAAKVGRADEATA
jgi:hypothetical protein